MASLSKLLREALGIDVAGDFPYTFPILWEEGLSKGISKDKEETLNLTDIEPLFNVLTGIFQSLSLNDYIASAWVAYRLFDESIDISDYLAYARALVVDVVDSISPADYYTTVWNATTVLYQSLNIPDLIDTANTWIRSIPLAIAITPLLSIVSQSFLYRLDTLALGDYYSREWDTYNTLYLSLSSSDFVDNIVSWVRRIDEPIDIASFLSTVQQATASLLDTLSLSDYRISGITQIIYQSLTLLDYVMSTTGEFYSELYTEALSISLELWRAVFKPMVESVSLLPYLATITPFIRSELETLNLSDYVTKVTNISKFDAIGLLDYYTRIWTIARTILQTTDITDYLVASTQLVQELFDSIDIGDVILWLWTSYATYVDPINISPFLDYVSQWYNTLFHALDVSDSLILSNWLLEEILQSIDLEDYISDIWTATIMLVDPIAVGDYWNRIWDTYFNILQSISLSDPYLELFIGLRRSLWDPMAMTDYWDRIWDHHFPPLIEQLTLFDTGQFPQLFRLTLVFFLWVFDYIDAEASRIEKFLEQLTIFSGYSRIWSTSLDWPKTAEGILLFNYYSYSHDMIRPLADALYLFDYHKWLTTWSRPLAEALTLVDYWVTAGITILVADALSLLPYLDTVSQFYRSFSSEIDVYTVVEAIWTIYRRLAENLLIPDVYNSIQTIIWSEVGSFSLGDYVTWVSTWSRLPVETLSIGEYLYNLYRYLSELSLNIGDFGTYNVEFYRMRLETLTMTSTLDYIGTFLREQVMQLSLVDDLDYLYVWTRVFTDTMILFSDLSRISTFTRRYTEDLDITSFLTYVTSTLRVLYETLDITSYFDVVLNWYRVIVIEPISLSTIFSYSMTWAREYLEATGIVAYAYNAIGMPMVETLSHLDYLATVTSYPREFIENLSLQDIFEYGWIFFSILLAEVLDPSDYLSTSTSFKRVIYQITDISSYLQNIVAYSRLPSEFMTLLDIHPIFTVIKIVILPLSLVDDIVFSMWKPFLTQLQYLGFQTLKYNISIIHALQLIEEYDIIWQSYLHFVETLDITGLLIRSVVSLYNTTDLYLKKITADLTARFSRMIRA